MDYEQDPILKQYIKDIQKYDLITPKEEIELADRIKTGDQTALEKLINANLRLVVKIAQDYKNYGVPLMDLISEGNIGLMTAAERFDPAKGGKMSTYAAWWIKQSIRRALSNQSKTIRTPVHMYEKASRLQKTTVHLSEEFGREPTDQELSEELGLPLKKVILIKQSAQGTASLDAENPEGLSIGATIADPNTSDPSTAFQKASEKVETHSSLDILSPRQRAIIEARFPLDGRKGKTLQEVGAEFGVTRERIRQVQNIALKKLRNATGKQQIEESASNSHVPDDIDLNQAQKEIQKAKENGLIKLNHS